MDLPKTFGTFEVLEHIGRGATATVYKVRGKYTGKIAALKVGPSMLMLEPSAVERFRRELTVIRPLEHPNIVRALGSGEQDGIPYLVLEYVPGQNLDQRLKERGPLSPPQALAVFLQVAEGLRYLHENDILHRDIKPSNIFLTPDNQAKLGDFGLVKNLNTEENLTQSRQAMGTVDYGAPEQFEDAKSVDKRCDLYSLAASLYSALTGKFPFGNGAQLQILQRKVHNQYVPLRLLLPFLAPALDDLVSSCLEPCPPRRPGSCDEFLDALHACASSLLIEAGQEEDCTSSTVKLPRGKERRASLRFAIDLSANFVPFHQFTRGQVRATILDISLSGLRLQTSHAIPVQSVLQVTLGKRTSSDLAFVRWVKPGPGQTHVVGCSFVHPLSTNDLDTIRDSGSRQMIRR
jgi:serine/threonine protein kinase